MSSRYANPGQGSYRPRAPRPYPQRGSYTPRQQYQRQQAVPGAPGEPARTISGLPVGYQMELDKRDAQIRQMGEALNLLYYEREQSDTEACAAEISRLAAAGFAVGEYEFQELKAKSKDQRAAYLQHIVTKYQRVGTDQLPPILGDPTPADAPQRGPVTEEEMHAALKMSAGSPDPNAYSQALQYIRSGGRAATMYGAPQMPFNPDPTTAFGDPYEPSQNGVPGY